jgi:hypothetical protein
MDEAQVKKYLIISGIVVVVLIIFIASSFDTVEPIEWGLKYNSISKAVKNGTSNFKALFLY